MPLWSLSPSAQQRHAVHSSSGASTSSVHAPRVSGWGLSQLAGASSRLSRFLGDLAPWAPEHKPRESSPARASSSGRVLAPAAPEAPHRKAPKAPQHAGKHHHNHPHHQRKHDHPQRPKQLTISWAGSGLYFFWQLGAMKYLAEHYDLSKVPMTGASGGSICAVLAACGVPADLALRRAYELSLHHKIWQEPGSFLGVWGGLVEEWLDELLPDDAHERCRGLITVVVTTLPDCRQVGISDFHSKRDLIDAVMASSHIPLVLDRRVMKHHRGRPCVDGSFPDFFFGNCELLTRGGGAVVFDYFEDTALKRQGRMDMLLLTSVEDLQNRMALGYDYARRLRERGAFDALEEQQRGAGYFAAGAAAAWDPDAAETSSVVVGPTLDELLSQQAAPFPSVGAQAGGQQLLHGVEGEAGALRQQQEQLEQQLKLDAAPRG